MWEVNKMLNNKKKNKLIVMFCGLMLLLFLVGCTNQIAGTVTSKLTADEINDGGTTDLEIKAKNTGSDAVDMALVIITEDAEKVLVEYPASLESTLQSGEQVTKIVKVTGLTDHTSTEYWIKVQLINKATNEVLDEKTEWLTVVKGG